MVEDLLPIAVVFLLAGTIKGITGIGLPTVSVAILSQFIPPHDAVALVVFPLLLTNLWQVIRTRAGLTTLKKYSLLICCLMVTLFFTTFLTLAVSARQLLTIIGIAVLIFAASSLLRSPPALPEKFETFGQACTGVAAGILGGFTSIWSPPVVIYLLSKRTEPDEFVRAAGLFIFLGGIPLAVGFWNTGLLNGSTAPASAVMIIPSLIGFSLGEFIRKRLDAEMFRKIVLWVFLVVGLRLIFPA